MSESVVAAPKYRQHPAYAAVAAKRAADLQLKIADAITKFAGSMTFVYAHVLVFAGWMLFVERNPWPTLTLVVSLEAIFLSTFVMIGQNRQAAYQQAKADHDFSTSEQELHVNTDLTRAVHELLQQNTDLTRAAHEMLQRLAAVTPSPTDSDGVGGRR